MKLAILTMITLLTTSAHAFWYPEEYCYDNYPDDYDLCMEYFMDEAAYDKSTGKIIYSFVLTYVATKTFDEVYEMVKEKYGPQVKRFVAKKYREAEQFLEKQEKLASERAERIRKANEEAIKKAKREERERNERRRERERVNERYSGHRDWVPVGGGRAAGEAYA